jgi:DNA repair protein SbcC/Rad50
MWVLKSIKIERLMAFESVHYDFLEGKTVMVQGKNLTDSGANSNGSCKSAILEAIGLSLTGRCIRLDTSPKDLVQFGEKSAYISLFMENKVLNQSVVIDREIFSNTKSATLNITLNNKPMSDITSVNEGNDKIIELLGIEKDDLLNFFLISKEKYVPFYKLSDTAKKALIGRFSNSDLIAPAEIELDENITSISNEITSIDSKIDRCNVKIETYMNDMNSFSVEELVEKRDAKIQGINNSIESYKEKIITEDDKLIELDKELDSSVEELDNANKNNKDNSTELLASLDEKESDLRDDLKSFDSKLQLQLEELSDKRKIELSSIDDKEKEFKLELNDARAELKEAEELLAKVENGLTSSVECPKCSHEFSPGDASLNIEKAKAKKSEIQGIIKDIETDINDIKGDVNKLDSDRSSVRLKYNDLEKECQNNYTSSVESIRSSIKDINTSREDVNKKKKEVSAMLESIQSKIDATNSKIRQCNRIISSYNEEISSLNEEIKTIEGKIIEDRKIEFKAQIDAIEDEIEVFNKDREDVEIKLSKAKEEKEVFIQFKAHLAIKAIATIEARSNHYLDISKSNLSIQMDGYKVNRNGEVKEKISTTVLRNGIVEGGIGQYSSGEKVRIEMANILALKSIINSSSKSGGLDFILLDEIINSVDSDGTGGVIKMLDATGETSMLITHSTFEDVHENILTVIKENGVSTLKID